MGFTTTLTSKHQLTLPKPVRERLSLKKGIKIDIYPTHDGGFIGMPRRKSKIMEFAGNLKSKDDGRSWKEIREKTDRIMTAEYAAKLKR